MLQEENDSLRNELENVRSAQEQFQGAVDHKLASRLDEFSKSVETQATAMREAVEAELRKRARRETDLAVERDKT